MKKKQKVSNEINGIKTHCKYDELLSLKELKDHPKNPNGHGQDQIERLAKLYSFHGIRHPIIVSKLTGFVVAGHGRKLSAIRAGMKEFPVVYQDFKDAEAEYSFMTSDNAISEWSELDFSKINLELENLGPDFDIDLLGIKDFALDLNEKEFDPSDTTESEKQHKTCPNCGVDL